VNKSAEQFKVINS